MKSWIFACFALGALACADDTSQKNPPESDLSDASGDLVVDAPSDLQDVGPDRQPDMTVDISPDASRDETPDLEDMMAADETLDLPPKPPKSRCEVTDDEISCPRQTRTIDVGLFDTREVHWQEPEGPPPADGWPVVLLFQGSLFSAEFSWVGARGFPFGGFYQVQLIQVLLDAGFIVITPEARFNGGTFWDTNIAPYNVFWETSGDHDLMLDIFAGIEAGDFGEADASKLYATGISSGGYMTSRMAVSYEGRFRALAIQSASYATCGGPVCLIPSLPDDHPPTLFLHGTLDATVPQWTMELYHDDLVEMGVPTGRVVDPFAGHEWIDSAPAEVLQWFQDH